MKIRIWVGTYTLLVSLLAAACAALGAPPEGAVTEAEAISIASKFTGFADLPGVTISAHDEIVVEDDVPFLEIAGREVWRVTFDNVRITYHGPSGRVYENPYIHRFDVLVDKLDGTPLKAVSPLPPGRSPETTRAEREMWLAREGLRYEKPPEPLPESNVLEVLASTGRPGTIAKQIEGLYVMRRFEDGRDFAAWIITLRYLPPQPPLVPQGAPEIPLPPYQHLDNTLYATGKLLYVGRGWKHDPASPKPLYGPGPCVTVPASAEGSNPHPTVVLNGGDILSAQPKPILVDGVTFVSLMALCDSLGTESPTSYRRMEVSWDGEAMAARAYDGDKLACFTVGEKIASINGQEVDLRQAPYILDGRIMVPLRELVEGLGGTIKWLPEHQIVYATYHWPEQTPAQTEAGEAQQGAPEGLQSPCPTCH